MRKDQLRLSSSSELERNKTLARFMHQRRNEDTTTIVSSVTWQHQMHVDINGENSGFTRFFQVKEYEAEDYLVLFLSNQTISFREYEKRAPPV